MFHFLAYDNNGVGTNFGVGGRRGEARRAERGDGVLGEGTDSPSPPSRGVAAAEGFFLYSEPSDCLSQHLSTCCIQFAWLGIRFF